MRTAVAVVFAAAVVGVVVYLAWGSLAPRIDDTPDTGAQDLFEEVAAAWESGDDDALSALFARGADTVLAGLDAVAAGLAPSDTTVTVDAVTVEDNQAIGDLTVALEVGRVGTVTWQTRVPAERRRGEWSAVGAADVVHPEFKGPYEFAVVAEDTTRAAILGHDGTALTSSSGQGYRVGFAPNRIRDEGRLLQAWADTLPDSLDALVDELERGDLVPDWFYPVATITASRYEEVRPAFVGIPGVIFRSVDGETATGDAFGQHVLGRVGRPTAEQAAELKVPADQVVGLYGLERAFDDQLVGSQRTRAIIRRGGGIEVAELAAAQPDASSEVRTTLDATVQQAVENALEGVSQPAAVVAVDGATSAIRASASRPLEGYNRAWEGRYAPGDGLLPMTAAVVYANGFAPDDPITCPAEAVVVGARLTAPVALGSVDIERALAAACDTTTGALVAELDDGALTSGATDVGFGTELDLPLPARGGSFPDPVDTTERVRAGVGRGRVQTSPLHLATVVAATVTGSWRPPFVLAEQAPDPEATPEPTIATTAEVQALLARGATPDGGVGFLAGTGAGAIGGTAPETGSDVEHAWVVGTVDELAFTVLAEDVGGDRLLANTIAQRFVAELAALRS